MPTTHKPTPTHLTWLVSLGLCLSGCTGPSGSSGSSGSNGSTTTGGGSGASGGSGGDQTVDGHVLGSFSPAPGGLRRLTSLQYRNTLRDLLGEVVSPQDIEPDVGNFGLVSLGVAVSPISTHGIEQFDSVAVASAKKVMTDPLRRVGLVGCTPIANDPSCATDFAQRFGRRAFRRPLSSDELATYARLGAAASASSGDPWIGLEMILVAMLESPKLLYRLEIGAPDSVDPARRSYSGFEMATRMAYLIWNTTPDDSLLSLAKAGDLSTTDGIRRAVSEMFTSGHAHEGLPTFFAELLNLDRVSGLHKDPTRFPQMSDALAASMQAETLALFDDIVLGQNTDYLSILESNSTWVDRGLAQLYGLPPPENTGLVRVMLPEAGNRIGLLGQASFLAMNAHETETSPTRRGKLIRKALLCQDVPAPPPGVNTMLKEPAGGGHRTKRQQLTEHRDNPACVGCHALMDPVGLALENFDAIGAYRSDDQGLPLDTSGDLDGVAFKGPRELARAIRHSDDAARCAVEMLYQYAAGHVTGDGERAVLSALVKDFAASGGRLKDLVTSIAISDGFRYAGTPR